MHGKRLLSRICKHLTNSSQIKVKVKEACLYSVYYKVARWCNGKAFGLAISRSQVHILPRQRCVTTSGKLFTPVCLYHQAVGLYLDTGQRAVMLCGCEGNRRSGRKQWQPTAGWMTYGHLRADCLYTGISSGPNARYRLWEVFALAHLWSSES